MKTKFLLATATAEEIKTWQDKGYEVVFILGQKKTQVVRPYYSSIRVQARAGAL
jgi:hypothetical protein